MDSNAHCKTEFYYEPITEQVLVIHEQKKTLILFDTDRKTPWKSPLRRHYKLMSSTKWQEYLRLTHSSPEALNDVCSTLHLV